MHTYIHKRLRRDYTTLDEISSQYETRLLRDNRLDEGTDNSSIDLFLTYSRHLLTKIIQMNSEIRSLPFKKKDAAYILQPVRALLKGVISYIEASEIEEGKTSKTEGDIVSRIAYRKVVQVANLVRRRIILSRQN